MPKVVAIIQARMRSTRLPGKVLLKVLNKELLILLIERVKKVKGIDEIVIATSNLKDDDPIFELCEKNSVECFRGPEENVLERYFFAAKKYGAQIVVRLTADSPLLDPDICSQLIEILKNHWLSYDYVSNSLERSFPRGVEPEVFKFSALEDAHQNASLPGHFEHVTPYILTHPQKFKCFNLKNAVDYSYHRWTVDTPEDFELIKRIFEELYPGKPDFRMKDVLQLFEAHPDWLLINKDIQQKRWDE